MKLGLAFADFSWPVPVSQLGTTIINLARQADDAGFDSLWVMDHFFQIRLGGLPPESPMPEAYAPLAVLAGQTRRLRLGALVTSVAYRHPGVLLKTVTTLDVLSGGRMYLGVGAGAPFNRPLQGQAPPTRPRVLASRSRRWPSGSRCSRNCSRSRTRCGTATSRPSPGRRTE